MEDEDRPLPAPHTESLQGISVANEHNSLQSILKNLLQKCQKELSRHFYNEMKSFNRFFFCL